MLYRISRNGQQFGPYSEAEVARYMGTGNILPSDLAQAEGAEEWLPVVELFPATPGPGARARKAVPPPGTEERLYPDPPNLPWWMALVLGLATVLAFFVVWDIVEAAWLRRVQRSSSALWLYILVAVLYIAKLPTVWQNTLYNLGLDVPVGNTYTYAVLLLSLISLLAARFLFRRELLLHFNREEPLGLRLNWLMTLLFGGLYFQYQFNRINDRKRALHVSVPTA